MDTTDDLYAMTTRGDCNHIHDTRCDVGPAHGTLVACQPLLLAERTGQGPPR